MVNYQTREHIWRQQFIFFPKYDVLSMVKLYLLYSSRCVTVVKNSKRAYYMSNSTHAGTISSATGILRTFSRQISSGCFLSSLDSLLGYPIGDFQALQLIVLVVFGAVDKPITSCMLYHAICKFDILENFSILLLCSTYILMPHNTNIAPKLCVQNVIW